MVVAAILFLIAAIGQAFPLAVADLMFWRFIGGAGIGIASVIAPMYIAEIAPAHLRGRLGSLQQLAIVSGIFITALSNYIILQPRHGCRQVAETNARTTWLFGLEAWQWMFLVMIVPAVVYAVGALTLPESPRYLVATGKDEQAAEVLAMVYTGTRAHAWPRSRPPCSPTTSRRFSDLLGDRFGLRRSSGSACCCRCSSSSSGST